MTYSPSTLLITGVSGFLGRYFARFFQHQGWQVIGIDTSTPGNAPHDNLAAYYPLHLPDIALEYVLDRHLPSACIHCAGRSSVGRSVVEPYEDYLSGPSVTIALLDAIRRRTPLCRLIFLSSAAVYGDPQNLPIAETASIAPISPYGYHKWLCETLCQEYAKLYGLSTACVRIFSAYGPGLRRQVMWDICYKALVEKQVLLQGSGQESRDFIHAFDITRGIETIIKNAPMQGEVYNLANGLEVTIGDLATMILGVLDCGLSPTFDGIVPPGTPHHWQAEISKLKQLGFLPTMPFTQGVQAVAEWCRTELTGA